MATVPPPGLDRDPALHARLIAAYDALGPDYAPRTHLMAGDRARYVNRLIEAPSAYLRQHAHNPVDWREWSDAALEEAAARDIPLFVSVGYSTCHWCHVMEEESFDDEEIAAILNAKFLPIKIDREQRPDLDQVFILATQLQQCHAGWPNSVWLTPEGRPFHTGTYFPKPQFRQLLLAVDQAWRGGDRAELMRVADGLSEAINRHSASGEGVLDEAVHTAAAEQLVKIHNWDMGGFSAQTQFPQEGFLLFLMDHWRRRGDDLALSAALNSLENIAAGGIHDHVGGGFHRYTVDVNWRTPHFEKMLYNQGLLSRCFLEAYEIAAAPHFARAARRCFDYVLRDMTDADGAFFAAEDADSPDAAGKLEEGAFYVIPPGFADQDTGPLNATEPPTIEAGPVAHLTPRAEQDWAGLDRTLDALRRARDVRPRPLRDDKVIAGWNGLMIRAMAEGGVVLDEPSWLDAAERAMTAVMSRLWRDERLMRLHAEGAAIEEAILSDYAWMGLAALALHDGGRDWLGVARMLADQMVARFAHPSGRLKMTEADGPIGPVFDQEDGATPSGESAALELLARLDRRTEDAAHGLAAARLLSAISGPMAQVPTLRTDGLTAARILHTGESGARRSLARGAVRAHLADGRLVLQVAPGWSLDPAQTGLTGATADWPAPTPVALDYDGAPKTGHQGRITLALTDPGVVLTLRLQACATGYCLPPETAEFRTGATQ